MTEPYRDPARAPYVGDRKNNTLPWTMAALAGAAVLGLVIFGVTRDDDERTVGNPPAVTTGQNDGTPARPIPMNPNATTPQPDPSQPQR